MQGYAKSAIIQIMNGFQKIIYKFLEMKERALKKKLSKHLKTKTKNSTSKMVLSNSATLTLTSETEKNIEIVKKNVSDIVKSCNNNPGKLLDYVKSKGTKIYYIDNADKILSAIKEEEGLITQLEGFEALYLNSITKSGFSLKSKPMFVMRKGEIDSYYMAHQFYKWYALKMNLPGFDYMSQKLFKIYLNSDAELLSNLNLDEMVGLKEAVKRDKEATDFALSLAREREGSKKVLDKIKEGGANI